MLKEGRRARWDRKCFYMNKEAEGITGAKRKVGKGTAKECRKLKKMSKSIKKINNEKKRAT